MKVMDWLENFFFKYFSKSTENSEDWWVRWVVMGIFLLPFSLGFVFTVIGLMDLVRICMWALLIMFVPFAITWIVVYFYHNWRLRKINKNWK